MLSPRLAAALAATLAVALPASARAADPVMPLDQVQAGMRCTGYSVIRGTAISSFDVDVIDVLDGIDPQVLVRVSGPAVDDTGIAEGFSGSPVYCPDGDGTPRVIGAIAQGTGDYGNKVVLVTPIQLMLGEPVVPPSSAKAMSASLRRRARPLAVPLSFAGVSGPVAAALRDAGRRMHRAVYAAPAAPRASFPAQPLQPGSAVAVGVAGGDVSAGAVGTVTYVDGNTIYAFGHPLDGAGRRALLLQDAYVYTVIGNPLDTEDVTSYKLAAPGRDLGTLSDDAPAGVVGTLGALPEHYPLHITGTDLDSGRAVHENVELTDETALGLPTGSSALTQVGPVAVAQTAYDVLQGSPASQSGRMCVRLKLRERARPLRFCNTYVGGSAAAAGAAMAGDLASAGGLLDAYKLGTVHVTEVDVDLGLRRDLRQAYLLRAKAPAVARRGHDIRVRLSAQRVRGAHLARTVTVHVPRYLSAGEHTLVLTGTPADGGAGSDEQALASIFALTLDASSGDAGSSDSPGPRSLTSLAHAFSDLHREDGVTASFRDPGDTSGESATSEIEVLDDPDLRFSGRVKLRLLVMP